MAAKISYLFVQSERNPVVVPSIFMNIMGFQDPDPVTFAHNATSKKIILFK